MVAEDVAYDEFRTFFEDGWIEEVLFPVKSGKEATVYCCRAGPGRGEAYFALKAYRSRQDRNFRNAAIYQEGRILGDARTTRAVRNKSRFGRAVEFGGWLHHEFATLSILHPAGAAVPRPVAVGDRAILLEFIGENGQPAPQLCSVRLSPAVAELLLEQALRTIEIMLSCMVAAGRPSRRKRRLNHGSISLEGGVSNDVLEKRVSPPAPQEIWCGNMLSRASTIELTSDALKRSSNASKSAAFAVLAITM